MHGNLTLRARLGVVGDDRRSPGLAAGGSSTRAGREQGDRQHHPAQQRGPYLASIQFLPTPTSTASGGSSGNARSISRTTIAVACSTSSSGASKSSSSWFCRLRLVFSPVAPQ